MIKNLDFSIIEPSERVEAVRAITEGNPDYPFKEYELEYLANYIVFAQEKKEKKEARERGEHYSYKREIITPGRQPTIDKREISYQGLAEKLESEDLIADLVRNDKNMILSPKIQITDEDRENIPFLAQVYESIQSWEHLLANTVLSKRDAWHARMAVIELRREQYIIKEAYLKPTRIKFSRSSTHVPCYDGDTGYENEKGEYVLVSENYLDFRDHRHIAALMKNYGDLKMDSADKLHSDMKYILWVLEDLIEKYIKEDYPHYFDIIAWRVDKLTNQEIADKLLMKHGLSHTPEYISNLATQRIPKIIADGYVTEYVMWAYTHKIHYEWKKCNRCGEKKPRLFRFWSKNKGSKDGLYSICKSCRSTRNKK